MVRYNRDEIGVERMDRAARPLRDVRKRSRAPVWLNTGSPFSKAISVGMDRIWAAAASSCCGDGCRPSQTPSGAAIGRRPRLSVRTTQWTPFSRSATQRRRQQAGYLADRRLWLSPRLGGRRDGGYRWV